MKKDEAMRKIYDVAYEAYKVTDRFNVREDGAYLVIDNVKTGLSTAINVYDCVDDIKRKTDEEILDYISDCIEDDYANDFPLANQSFINYFNSKNISMYKLSKMSGISESTLSDISVNKKYWKLILNVNQIEQIADSMKTTVNELLKEIYI